MKNKERSKPAWGIVFPIITLGLLIGALVPLLIDFTVDRKFDYSIIVVGAIAMTWLIIAPWFVLLKNRLLFSWTAAIISVPIFLYIIELINENKGWFLTLGLPSAIIGLTAIGAIIWLWIGSRLKVWYAVSSSFFLIALLSFTEHFFARPYLEPDPYESTRYFVSFCLLSASLLLAIIASLIHRFKLFKEE